MSVSVTRARPAATGGESRRWRDAFYAAYELVRRANRVAVGVACALIVLITLLTVWEAFTRYFLREPAAWTYPVAGYMLLYSIYLALGYTLQRGGHVSVDVIVEILPPRGRRWLRRLGHTLGLAFTLVFLYECWRVFDRQLREDQRDTSALSTPMALISPALVIGLVLMALTYVMVLVDSFLCPPGVPTRQEREQEAANAPIELG